MAAVTPVAGEADATVIRESWTNPDRFAALYDRYAVQLYRYAYQRVGPQVAEDVVADTFLAAFGQRASYDLARPDARPWLFGILTRKLARHHRRERADYRALSRAAPDAVVDGPAERVAARVAAAAAGTQLASALARLSTADRDVLLLFAWGQLRYDEIATALQIPLGTVRSRLNRARRKVREALGDVDPARDHLADDPADRLEDDR
jgi:RNA polymerase sigma factor (sigma-70 family)